MNYILYLIHLYHILLIDLWVTVNRPFFVSTSTEDGVRAKELCIKHLHGQRF